MTALSNTIMHITPGQYELTESLTMSKYATMAP